MVLILLSGATIIWYIGATMRSLRLDRTLQRVAHVIRHTVRNLEHSHKRDSPAPATALQAPPDAIPVPAPASGYVVNIDTDRVHQLALRYDVAFGFDVLIGTPIILGQDVGWAATRNDGSPPPPAAVADTIDIARSRDPSYDVAYGIRILVDMAIMAMSPAVNDPYTAVEVVNELTLILVAIADLQPGPRGRTGPDGRFDVAVAGRTLSDYLDLAADQILLYGHTDPEVIAALSRLARTVEQASPSEPDRHHARNLADRIAVATTDTPTTLAQWLRLSRPYRSGSCRIWLVTLTRIA